MHADLCAEVQNDPAATVSEQQRVFDRWRQDFNHVRPHEALGGKTPAEVYKPTERRRPVPRAYEYPKRFYVARVDSNGIVRFRRDYCRVGIPFAGLDIGIEVIDARRVRFWLHEIDLGLFETIPAVDDACFEQPPVRRSSRRKTAA